MFYHYSLINSSKIHAPILHVNCKELQRTLYHDIWIKVHKIIDKNVETNIDSELVEMASSLDLHSIWDIVYVTGFD